MPVYKFEKGYSSWGANMGRSEYGEPPEEAWAIRLFRVDLDQGYDNGGAYWGNGQTLWCAVADGYRAFVRADSRREAMLKLKLKVEWLASRRDTLLKK